MVWQGRTGAPIRPLNCLFAAVLVMGIMIGPVAHEPKSPSGRVASSSVSAAPRSRILFAELDAAESPGLRWMNGSPDLRWMNGSADSKAKTPGWLPDPS